MKIAPLHIVTGYSFLQSGLTIDKIAKAYKQNHYYGMGISDRDVMYGVAPFVSMMKKPKAEVKKQSRVLLQLMNI